MRLTIGDIRRLGLRKLPYGPMQQVRRTKRIPMIDIGTLALIRDGKIKVRSGVARLDEDEVVFDDDSRGRFEVVVLATGYRPGVAKFLAGADTLDDRGMPTCSGSPTSVPGLYYCGFFVSPYGMLRAIADEARAISRHIARRSLPHDHLVVTWPDTRPQAAGHERIGTSGARAERLHARCDERPYPGR